MRFTLPAKRVADFTTTICQNALASALAVHHPLICFLCLNALPRYFKMVFRAKLNSRTCGVLNCSDKGFRRKAAYWKPLRLPVAFHPELPSLSL